jgi:P pilus assembly chaperone PapD
VPGQDKDLVWSPLQFTVQAKGQEYFKLYYRGPKDDVERYYRVIFKETPVTVFLASGSEKTECCPFGIDEHDSHRAPA